MDRFGLAGIAVLTLFIFLGVQTERKSTVGFFFITDAGFLNAATHWSIVLRSGATDIQLWMEETLNSDQRTIVSKELLGREHTMLFTPTLLSE